MPINSILRRLNFVQLSKCAPGGCSNRPRPAATAAQFTLARPLGEIAVGAKKNAPSKSRPSWAARMKGLKNEKIACDAVLTYMLWVYK